MPGSEPATVITEEMVEGGDLQWVAAARGRPRVQPAGLPAAVGAKAGMPIAQAGGMTATFPRHGTTLTGERGARSPPE
ncbi:MAG: hypothetical protein AABZ33_02015 [Chloroflexota bacterium]